MWTSELLNYQYRQVRVQGIGVERDFIVFIYPATIREEENFNWVTRAGNRVLPHVTQRRDEVPLPSVTPALATNGTV